MKNIDEKELARLLQLDAQIKVKEEKKKQYNLHRAARINLTLQKAEKAGITVSDQEVEDYLKAKR